MATKIEEIIAGLESILPRPLTDDEKDSIVRWQKCEALQQFLENFPHEWAIFKETLKSYGQDYLDEWQATLETPPNKLNLNISELHASAYAVNRMLNDFIAAVENAPEVAREVPDIVREGWQQLKTMPK